MSVKYLNITTQELNKQIGHMNKIPGKRTTNITTCDILRILENIEL